MNAGPKTSSVAVRTVAALAHHEAGAAEQHPTKAGGQWYAAAWSCHAKTTVLVDDPTALTGKHVIAECDTEENARLVATARELLDLAIRTERWTVVVEQGQIARGERYELSGFVDELRAAIAKAKP